jgi:hypothetical protein
VRRTHFDHLEQVVFYKLLKVDSDGPRLERAFTIVRFGEKRGGISLLYSSKTSIDERAAHCDKDEVRTALLQGTNSRRRTDGESIGREVERTRLERRLEDSVYRCKNYVPEYKRELEN